jgi:hypothetical protein
MMGGISPTFLGGVALGILAPTFNSYQDVVLTALAVAPIRLPYGLGSIAKGYVLGRIARPYVPSIGGIGGGGSDISFA